MRVCLAGPKDQEQYCGKEGLSGRESKRMFYRGLEWRKRESSKLKVITGSLGKGLKKVEE